MAIGDDALAAGYPLVPNNGEEGKVKWGAREINRTRDFVAQVKASIASIWGITRGGTGASTAAQARTNLGLGSVATQNIVPMSMGGTGVNAGTNLDLLKAKGAGLTSISQLIATITSGTGSENFDYFFPYPWGNVTDPANNIVFHVLEQAASPHANITFSWEAQSGALRLRIRRTATISGMAPAIRIFKVVYGVKPGT